MPEQPPKKLWPRAHSAQPRSSGSSHTELEGARYIELQLCSNFSFLRGASHPEELVLQAKLLGYPMVGLTDRHSLAGVVRAHAAAKEAGITLLVGTQLLLYEDIPREPTTRAKPLYPGSPLETLEVFPGFTPPKQLPFSLLLYPTSRRAYGNLSALLSVGKMRAPKGACYVELEDLRDYHTGLLAIIVIHNLRHPQLLAHLETLKAIFKDDRLSLAMSATYGPDNYERLRLLEQLGQLAGIPRVVTNDVQYHLHDRKPLQDVLTCIRLGCTLPEAGFALFQNAERHLKTPQEMQRLFRAYPEALRRSTEIAQLASHFSLDELTYEYPHEVCPEGKAPIEHLSELTYAGAAARYPQGVPPAVARQLAHELKLIEELRYEKYFLTVHDIVSFAREREILCQGRGAAANSAVCYVLGITAVDPDKVRLLFERFVSKERNEPPDIDIDFEHERREEVIQYLYTKYGRHRAALTASVITYRTRSAVRDVGKVFNLPLETVEQIIKLLRRSRLTTEDGEPNEKEFKARGLSPDDPAVRDTITFAMKLRGFPRHLSQHVGGFVISEEPLSRIVPIENASMPDRTVIEWDKDDIETMGMLKIDILGLGMLTVLRKSFALLNERTSRDAAPNPPSEALDLYNIPREDPLVYEMVCRADTIGVFQIESRAQMNMLPRLRPKCFYDLVIEVAIVRPGPIQGGMVHPYIRRRNGQEAVTYPSPEVAEILSPTLGVPIFQEQVMELAVVAAGFTPGEADQLRRAMASWKKNGNLNRFRDRLLSGMRAKGYSAGFANQLFEQIQGFGEYGFPQSHSASFALLAYVSAWLKCHHPAAFAAALLNSQPMGFYQPAQIINDARAHGVVVRPIDVNHSGWDCRLEDPAEGSSQPVLRLGMRLVRGLKEREARMLEETVRLRGPYRSLFSLWRESMVSAAELRKLARADAFGSLSLGRQQALWELRKFRDEPLPLFERKETLEAEPAGLPPFSAYRQMLNDYASFGLTLQAHPLSFFRKKLSREGVVTAYELKYDPNHSLLNGTRCSIAGVVLVRQRPGTASGVVFITIEDETGMANLIVRPKVFARFQDTVCDSSLILAHGRVQREGELVHLLLEEVDDLTPEHAAALSISRDFH